MFDKIPAKSNIVYTTILLTITMFFYAENTTTLAYAESSRDYLFSSCINAYQQYQNYNAQPIVSPTDSKFSTSTHNMRMANQALNTVTDCAIKYANLVGQDSSYCNNALSYMEQISPIMLTSATVIIHECLR